MKQTLKFPIRLKIMVSLLCGITAVVTVITFTMANFFHDDKRSYLNDWVSIAAVSTAEETRALLDGYAERLRTASLMMLSEEMGQEEREQLLERVLGRMSELVEIAIYQDGVQIELLAAADDELSTDRLEATRAARRESLGDFSEGQVRIRSAVVSETDPTFSMGFALSLPDESPVEVLALLRNDELLRMGANFKVFQVILTDEEGILLAHPDASRVAQGQRSGIRQEESSRYKAGSTQEYEHEGQVVIGGSAPAAYGVSVATHLPRAAAYLASRQLLRNLLGVAIGLLLSVAIIGRLWARRIVRPMERLSAATRTIAEGDFDVEIDVASRDEIGDLAESFNQMASGLKDRDEALVVAQSRLVQSEKMSAFGQISAGIAHEVKNPLAGILGCTQVALLDAEPNTMLEGNLLLIEKETARCAEIVNNLMRFARQEKAELEPTQVNMVVNDAVAIINHQLQMNQVKVIQDLEDEIDEIQGSSNQLQQVLMNLMINAQQAMDGKGSVTVSTRQLGDTIELKVRDDGPGIPSETLPKLFEPFFTTKPTGMGTGLGLSVTYGIVQEHHGEISVSSEVGQGTEFTIRLPRLSKS